MSIRITEDGYLLVKSMHKDCLQGEMDMSRMTIPAKHTEAEMIFARNIEDGKIVHEYYITLLMGRFHTPDEHDAIYYYEDYGALSGSSGYVWIRKGYVQKMMPVVMR